jgi:hypothetical protein
MEKTLEAITPDETKHLLISLPLQQVLLHDDDQLTDKICTFLGYCSLFVFYKFNAHDELHVPILADIECLPRGRVP